jgi:hypothetical protein
VSAVHLTAAPADNDIRVTWESTDNLAGVDDGACTLDVRTDGAWEPHPVACAGAWDYGEPGHLYEFRVTARDHVGNAARAVAQADVPSVTKYYVHGGQRVALRRDGVIYYLHTDHPSAARRWRRTPRGRSWRGGGTTPTAPSVGARASG